MTSQSGPSTSQFIPTSDSSDEESFSQLSSLEDSDEDSDFFQEEDDKKESGNEEGDIEESEDRQVWDWTPVDFSYRGNKIPFSGNPGCQKDFETVLDSFLLFFDNDIMQHIVNETNRYAEQYLQSHTLKRHSRLHKWQPVTIEEMYVLFAVYMLMGIVQKPSVSSYFSKDGFLDTPIFAKIISQRRFEVLSRFLHFVDK